MPRLTLPPQAALIDDAGPDGANSLLVPLTGPDEIAGVGEQVVGFVACRAPALAADIPDAAAMDARLQLRIDAPASRSEPEESDDRGPSVADLVRLRLVVLAGMGRLDEVRALLATYPLDREAAEAGHTVGRADRRFVRQLTRWLDAGGPIAPPVEDTLAQLPRRPLPPRPTFSWSDAQARARAKREALDAARAQARGKTPEQLKDLIAAEYGARGFEIAPSLVALDAELLQFEQRPFGRARQALRAVQMLTSTGGAVVRAFTRGSDDPAWLRPPDRAAYPVIEHPNRFTPLELDAAAHDWLERAGREATRQAGPVALVDVWLTPPATEQ